MGYFIDSNLASFAKTFHPVGLQMRSWIIAHCLDTKLNYEKWALSNSTSQASKINQATKTKGIFEIL